jgi:hypothetical protein
MQKVSLPAALFIANATVLMTHQIDAAYWHEWELFRIPGGNQLNLILNLPILTLILIAHRETILGGKYAHAAHRLVASLGFLTVFLHSVFFAFGSTKFLQPVSVALLVSTGLLSTMQLVALQRANAAANPGTPADG